MGTVITFRAEDQTLTRLDLEAASLDEATLQLPHGIYTVFRLYPGGKIVRWEAHLRRFEQSARLLDFPFALSGDWLRAMTRRAVAAAGFELSRVRLTIPFDAPDSALILVEPFTPPPRSLYDQGVKVDLVEFERERPQAKHTHFVERRQQVVAGRDESVYEVIMVNGDGFLREGSTSNFYALLDGQLRTAADEGVLAGIARAVLLQVAPDIAPIRLEMVHRSEVAQVSEAMLTSASRGVFPVVQIGDLRVGDGRPGPVFGRLRAAYEAQIARELEVL